MKKFENFHPVVLMCFFSAVILPAVFVMDIAMSAVILTAGIIYLWILNGKACLQNIFLCIFFTAGTAIFNMLVSHNGSRVLFFINNRAVTKEACVYGINTGLMICGAFIWFMCMDKVITGEKVLCVFRRTPKLALLISMILRLVPGYISKYKRVMEVQGDGADKLSVMSGVFTYALENSMCTAESMQMRGFGKAKPIYRGYAFKAGDGMLLALIIVFTAINLFLPPYRKISVGIISVFPIIYRAKESVKLWKYNLKR